LSPEDAEKLEYTERSRVVGYVAESGKPPLLRNKAAEPGGVAIIIPPLLLLPLLPPPPPPLSSLRRLIMKYMVMKTMTIATTPREVPTAIIDFLAFDRAAEGVEVTVDVMKAVDVAAVAHPCEMARGAQVLVAWSAVRSPVDML